MDLSVSYHPNPRTPPLATALARTCVPPQGFCPRRLLTRSDGFGALPAPDLYGAVRNAGCSSTGLPRNPRGPQCPGHDPTRGTHERDSLCRSGPPRARTVTAATADLGWRSPRSTGHGGHQDRIGVDRNDRPNASRRDHEAVHQCQTERRKTRSML